MSYCASGSTNPDGSNYSASIKPNAGEALKSR